MAMLSERQKRLVEEYLIDLSPSGVAKRIDASPQWVKTQLNETMIQDAIEMAMFNRSQRVQITQDEVLISILEIQADAMQKVINDKLRKRSTEGELIEVESIIDRSAALKSAELLGKHLKMFTDKVDIGGDSDNPLSLAVEFVNKKSIQEIEDDELIAPVDPIDKDYEFN